MSVRRPDPARTSPQSSALSMTPHAHPPRTTVYRPAALSRLPGRPLVCSSVGGKPACPPARLPNQRLHARLPSRTPVRPPACPRWPARPHGGTRRTHCPRRALCPFDRLLLRPPDCSSARPSASPCIRRPLTHTPAHPHTRSIA